MAPHRDENSMAESAERAFRALQQGGAAKEAEGLPAGVRQVLRLFASRDGAASKDQHDPQTIRKPVDGVRASKSITIDRFRLIRPIGQGGFGVVYLARDTLLDRVVALKLPKPHVLLNGDLRSRFLREARAASNLHHAHIAQVYDASEVNESSFIACEYCDGGSLEDWLTRQAAPLDAQTTARLVAQLADAVHYAHTEGILHRDLKPSNILLKSTPNSRTGEMPYVAKVADFGLAKLQSWTDERTVSGVIMGSIRYMSPEQALARPGGVDARSDVYALGVILYQLLAGQVPFDSDSQLELLRDVVERSPPSVRQVSPETPRDLASICMRCLEKQPGRRYQSAGELRDDLHRFLAGQSTVARPVSSAERMLRWTTHNRARAALAGVILASVLAGVIGLLFHNQRMRNMLVELGETKDQLNQSLNLADERERDLRVQAYCSELTLAYASWHRLRPRSAAALLKRQQDFEQRGVEWSILHSRVAPAHQILMTSPNSVHAAMHPNGRILAVADESDVVHLFDLETGKIADTLTSPMLKHRELAFSPDGKYLAVSSTSPPIDGDGSEVGWFDMTTQTFVRRLGRHPTTVETLAFDPDSRVLLSASRYEDLRLWSVPTGELLVTEPTFSRNERACVSPCGRWLVYSTYGENLDRHQLEVCDFVTGKPITTIREHRKDEVVCFTSDGQWMALSSHFGIEIYQTGSFELLDTISDIRELTSVMTFSPDDRLLYAAAKDGTLRVWEFRPPSKEYPLDRNSKHILPAGCANLHDGRIRSMAFDQRGWLATAGDDGTVRLSDPAVFAVPERVGPKTGKLDYLAAAANGSLAVAMYHNNRIWLKTGEESRTIELASEGIDWSRRVALSPDAQWLAFSWADSFGVVDTHQPDQIVWQVEPSSARVTSIHFVPRRPWLVTTQTDDHRLYVWNRVTGEGLHTKTYDFAVTAGDFSPDGRVLVLTPGDERYFCVCDGGTFEVLRRIPIAEKPYSALFNHDGSILATGHIGGQIGLWDTSTWKPLHWLTEHQQHWLKALAFSPDDRTLASGGTDGTIRFWHIATGRALGQLSLNLPVHVIGLAFAPDGRALYVATEDDPLVVRWPIPEL